MGDIALTVAAVLGTVCIGLVIAAVFFDVRIILFSTGSMSPTIPAGSAAIVRQIPASEIEVGDVITVDRPGKLPITHRATSVSPVPGGREDARLITMRGDANAVDDPFPYEVTGVRLVVFSVPGIAPAVASLGNPWVLGSVTIGATVLVVWVFWPRRPKRRREVADGERRPRRDGAGAVAGLAVLVGVGAVLAFPVSARAETDETVTQGRVIRLVSIEQPQMSDLAPGTSAVWQVGVSADAPSPGIITVQLSSTGAAVLALDYDVQSCEVRWQDDGCATPTTLLGEQPVPLDGEERDILEMPSDEERWLRILVTRPDDGDPEASGAVDIVVRAVGVGDDVSTSPGAGGLPATGGGAPWVMGSLSVLLLAAGSGLALRSRRPT
ncbi:hypothetical protein [Microbacterium sulfonylureivorans]|uniref:hypothetical protein n=1 Tax=Microbacterium sulfonylureivorans TaxID=2486854 RepID=UPI00197C88C6|nr:hypothetical protein [Microbacterium sulfonylureivorans]